MASADGEGLEVEYGLHEVMKVVEAAEATIKQQVDDNNRLRDELHRKTLELEKYSAKESNFQRPRSVGKLDGHSHLTSEISHIDDGERSVDESSVDVSGVLTLHQELCANRNSLRIQVSEDRKMNGTMKGLPSGQVLDDSPGSYTPERLQTEVDYRPVMNSSRQGMMELAEVNKSESWKQDIILKVRDHEEEISMLRKHLADYSIKEHQIRNEKYVLEKRIAHMRLAFDQQHQDIVEATSKAITYRQDIIEENIRLTYALQSAQEEKSTFVASILPLLVEYSLQPSVPDAQSIVSNLKVLFKHLTEKLIATETKLKECQYQLAPWHSDHPNLPLSSGATDGFGLVPQPIYSHGMVSEFYGTRQLNVQGETETSNIGASEAEKNEDNDLGRYSPAMSGDNRYSSAKDRSAQFPVDHRNDHQTHFVPESSSKQVTFSDHVSNSEMENLGANAHQDGIEASTNWNMGNTQYLAPVLEEPSSSFSEDYDPLPAIEGLQINGDAFPGHELQACGYQINGTTSCNFEWVRHWEDGSVNYIEGAKQPNYLVTADDVDACLAIEVQPLDDRKRKGELVKVFANDHRKITCDMEMHSNIEKALTTGHASYKVSLPKGFLNIWEPAILTIKKEGYNIKSSMPGGLVVNIKFSAAMIVVIPYGHVAEFSIICTDRDEHHLRVEGDPADYKGYDRAHPKILYHEDVDPMFDENGCVDESQFHKLKYLNMVIKEVLRLHLPAPLLIPRENSERCVANGFEVPSKTKIIINGWALARDPKYWTDSEKFYPERFLDSSLQFNGNEFHYVPFGAGRRICPGLTLGVTNAEVFMANLLFHFDWELGNGEKGEDMDMSEMFGATIARKQELVIVPILYQKSVLAKVK
ncbi:unnamed protein product [Rhodiola kirilowii]